MSVKLELVTHCIAHEHVRFLLWILKKIEPFLLLTSYCYGLLVFYLSFFFCVFLR